MMLLTLGLACPRRPMAGREPERLALQLLDSLPLSAQVAALGADQEGLLVPENSGTDILSIGFDLRPRPAIPIPQGITGIRGIAADAFSIYLCDDSRLFRLDRSTGTLTQLSSNLRYQGSALLASGELVFSDGYSGRILVFDPTGGVSDVNVSQLDFKPGALTLGRDNNLYVLNRARQEVTVMNRLGDVVRTVSLPASAIRIAVDDSLNCYLLERSGTRLWRVSKGPLSQHGRSSAVAGDELGVRFLGSDVVVHQDQLFLLDGGRRILKFQGCQ